MAFSVSFLSSADVARSCVEESKPVAVSLEETAEIGKKLFSDIDAIQNSLDRGDFVDAIDIEYMLANLERSIQENSETRKALERIQYNSFEDDIFSHEDRPPGAGRLYRACQDPAFDWKKETFEGGLVQDDWTSDRDVAYKEVCHITSLILGVEGSEFINIGSAGKKSDADITISYKDSASRGVADHARLGEFSAVAGLVWQAIFKGTSLQQADTEFYPPHRAQYMKFSEMEKASADYVANSMFASLLHAKKTDEDAYRDQIDIRESIGTGENRAAIICLSEYIESLGESDGQSSELLGEYKHLLNNLGTIHLSRQMTAIGEEIDKNPRGLDVSDLKVQYATLSTLRARYLPEAYYGDPMGPVCLDRGGQAYKGEQKKWNEWIIKNSDAFEDFREAIDTRIHTIEEIPLEGIGKNTGERVFMFSPRYEENLRMNLSELKDLMKAAGFKLDEPYSKKIINHIKERYDSKTDDDSLSMNSKEILALFRDPVNLFDNFYKKSHDRDLVASIEENFNFFCHRINVGKHHTEDHVSDASIAITDSSKYALRVVDAARLLLEGLDGSRPQEAKDLRIQEIFEGVEKQIEIWSNLEAHKRGNLSPKTLSAKFSPAEQKILKVVHPTLSSDPVKLGDGAKFFSEKRAALRFEVDGARKAFGMPPDFARDVIHKILTLKINPEEISKSQDEASREALVALGNDVNHIRSQMKELIKDVLRCFPELTSIERDACNRITSFSVL